MCREKDHGNRRCSADTSEARRKRRKAQKAKEAHIPHVAGRGSRVVRWDGLSTMEAIKVEAQEVSSLLRKPLTRHPDDPEQKAEDSALEIRMTRLGLALGEEAERRAGFNSAEYLQNRKDLDRRIEEAEDRLSGYWGVLNKKRDEWKDLSTEERAAKHEEMDRHRKAMADETWALRDEQRDYTQAFVKRLNEAHISVLAEIRELGGDVKVHQESAPEAVKVLSETAAKHFPSDWIKASNEAGPLVASVSSERSHYRSANSNPVFNAEGYPAVLAVLTGEKNELSQITPILESDGDNSLKVLDTPELVEGHSMYMVSMAMRVPFDPSKHKMNLNGTPEGDGWKHGYYMTESGISKEKQWYRHMHSSDKNAALAAITLPSGSYEGSQEKTTYHEFAHRSEDAMPNHVITRMENVFLNRRTTTKAGVQEELTLIYPTDDENYEPKITDEVGRKGNFIHHYVGKYYPMSRIKEVLSVGSEALFAGAYGSFVGLDGYKSDIDHRGFVLGILATA